MPVMADATIFGCAECGNVFPVPSSLPHNRAVCKFCEKVAAPIDGDELLDVKVCARCCAGLGGQCHTPGCSLWMHNVEAIPVNATQAVIKERRAKRRVE